MIRITAQAAQSVVEQLRTGVSSNGLELDFPQLNPAAWLAAAEPLTSDAPRRPARASQLHPRGNRSDWIAPPSSIVAGCSAQVAYRTERDLAGLMLPIGDRGLPMPIHLPKS